MAVRHKVFITYHQANETSVKNFIDEFDDVFIAKAIGVSDQDDFISSDDTDYVLRRIRELYLQDSTVTIVFVGDCTSTRKYVDWEIASTLRNDPNNKRSGLLGINMKSLGTTNKAPARLGDNFDSNADGGSYALYKAYPASKQALRNLIETALKRRDTQTPDNTRALRKNNSAC